MHIECDNAFALNDEGILLKGIGLPKTEDKDIPKLFDFDIVNFLKYQSLL